METLEVTKENALKAYNEGNEKQKALLINLFGKKHFMGKITDQIRTWDDVLEYHNTSQQAFSKKYGSLDEQGYANEQVKLIAAALNDGVMMDVFSTSQYKYYPYFDISSGGFSRVVYDCWGTYCAVGSRLCFKSADLAIYAGKTFINIYAKLLS